MLVGVPNVPNQKWRLIEKYHPDCPRYNTHGCNHWWRLETVVYRDRYVDKEGMVNKGTGGNIYIYTISCYKSGTQTRRVQHERCLSFISCWSYSLPGYSSTTHWGLPRPAVTNGIYYLFCPRPYDGPPSYHYPSLPIGRFPFYSFYTVFLSLSFSLGFLRIIFRFFLCVWPLLKV